MANSTIARPEWSTIIDPVLQKELEQHVLVTSWDKLLGMVDTVYNWGRRSSLWPLGFGLACCAIEMICTASSRFDIARFGAEVFRGSPRQADLMIVSGTVTKTMMPMIARLYDQMPEPKYVISMGACATGGGPFKEGYNVVSGIDKYLPVDVYIPGCPPTPQALLNGLIMLQKKIDGEKIVNSPWYRGDVERDIPIPVLGPDLIDLRTVELAAERTAQGLVEAREADLPKPPKIPAPQPEAEAADAPADGRQPRPPRPMSKIDMIRAKARGEAVEPRPRPRPPQPPPPQPPPPRPSPPAARRRSGPRPGPASSGWATTGSRSWPTRSTPSSARGPSRSSRRRLLVPAEKLVDVALYLRDKNPIKYDYLASLQSVHYEDCIEVNYQLDSIDTARQADRAAGADRRGRRGRARSPRSTTSTAGPTSRSARSTT